ncbi:hypothetical protein QR680_003530 [Steinernema hermaphroditum]|uniref:lysozyme n=1 Tax=Steinernema hermaphroditum TaxID=289476 RepID=A0AA39HLR1_9BILA|nr:hypothetical protein QR680_003530 [Steinernema hermaphroditum]
MLSKTLFLVTLLVGSTLASTCLHCICLRESGCKPIGCRQDMGSPSCGYYQIKENYYKDCGMPGKRPGESVMSALRRCADDFNCATQCVQKYYQRYKHNCKGLGECEAMSRNHNGGPSGCRHRSTQGYWNHVHSCCGCS